MFESKAMNQQSFRINPVMLSMTRYGLEYIQSAAKLRNRHRACADKLLVEASQVTATFGMQSDIAAPYRRTATVSWLALQ